MSESHYDVLRLRPDATVEEIKSGYKRFVRTEHPDVGGDAARFIRVKQAYDVLSDEKKKAAYDATLAADSIGSEANSSEPGPPRESTGVAFPALSPEGCEWYGAEKKKLDVRPPFYEDTKTSLLAPALAVVVLLVIALFLASRTQWYIPLLALSLVAFAMPNKMIRSDSIPPTVEGFLSSRLIAVVVTLAALAATYRFNPETANYFPAIPAALVFIPLRNIFSLRALRKKAQGVDEQVPRSAVESQHFASPSLSRGVTTTTHNAERTTYRGAVSLTTMPGVKILNGVQGSPLALLSGSRLLLVHSRASRPGRVWPDEFGSLMCEGQHLPDGDLTHVREAHRWWNGRVRGLSVRTVVVVHSPGRIAVAEDFGSGIEGVQAQEFLPEMGQWLAQESPVVERRILRDVFNAAYPQ